MTRHYPDLARASDWSCRMGNLTQPIESATQTLVVTRHQYGISAGKPVAASQNVGCFLRLIFKVISVTYCSCKVATCS